MEMVAVQLSKCSKLRTFAGMALKALLATGVHLGPKMDPEALLTKLVGEGWYRSGEWCLAERRGCWPKGYARWAVYMPVVEDPRLARATLCSYAAQIAVADQGQDLTITEFWLAVSRVLEAIAPGVVLMRPDGNAPYRPNVVIDPETLQAAYRLAGLHALAPSLPTRGAELGLDIYKLNAHVAIAQRAWEERMHYEATPDLGDWQDVWGYVREDLEPVVDALSVEEVRTFVAGGPLPFPIPPERAIWQT